LKNKNEIEISHTHADMFSYNECNLSLAIIHVAIQFDLGHDKVSVWNYRIQWKALSLMARACNFYLQFINAYD
jgi:hypothetical protein